MHVKESLKSFVEKYKPDKAVRASMSDYRVEDWLVKIPLYAIRGDVFEHLP